MPVAIPFLAKQEPVDGSRRFTFLQSAIECSEIDLPAATVVIARESSPIPISVVVQSGFARGSIAPSSEDRARIVVEDCLLVVVSGPGRDGGEPAADQESRIRREERVLEIHSLEPLVGKRAEARFIASIVGFFNLGKCLPAPVGESLAGHIDEVVTVGSGCAHGRACLEQLDERLVELSGIVAKLIGRPGRRSDRSEAGLRVKKGFGLGIALAVVGDTVGTRAIGGLHQDLPGTEGMGVCRAIAARGVFGGPSLEVNRLRTPRHLRKEIKRHGVGVESLGGDPCAGHRARTTRAHRRQANGVIVEIGAESGAASKLPQATKKIARNLPIVLLGTFAVLALLLASIGIYGVVSYAVMRRTPEIGIRMTLGANRGQIFRLIVNQAIWMAGAGLGIGVFASIALVRLLPSFSHLLYGVGQNDPFTLLVASAVLLIAAIVACYVPARRAMRIHPMDCLRTE